MKKHHPLISLGEMGVGYFLGDSRFCQSQVICCGHSAARSGSFWGQSKECQGAEQPDRIGHQAHGPS